MQSEQQQRIMGYFIEEAKDHLNTIEQGLLNLQGTIEDSDLVNEVFRAAHSVKGGAAMLGLDSIQQTAHRLEDYFKVLKECPLKVDQKLETLFLRVFDTLQDLLEQLQGPFGLTDDNAAQIMGDVEPVLSELHVHLNHLVEASGHTPPEDVDLSQPVPPAVSATSTRAGASKQEDSALTLYFQSDVPAQLRNMLGLFKQPDTAFVRQQLQDICSDLAQAGESFDLHPNWSELSSLAQRAIANPDNDFRQLAPALIKDFKQAQDRVLSGRSADITPSYALQEMQPVADVFTEDVPVLSSEDLLDDMTDFLSGSSDASMESDAADDPFASLAGLEDGDESSEDDGADFDLFGEETDSLDLNTDNLELDELVANNELDLSTRAIATPARQGPHVGTAELNSLADLFENEAPELDMDWQEEVIDNSSDLMVEGLVLDASNDFSDLLFDEAPPEQKGASHDADDISGILDSIEESSPLPSPPSVVAEDEFADLFSVETSSDD
ncbi:MAG: Hpt domain-containing protein, partial [Cyanobacteria bacterium P01_A01_bin.37]